MVEEEEIEAPANELLGKLAKGELVEYKDRIITGHLNLDDIKLSQTGHRTEADHNFFMEMEAKRRQNGITKLVHMLCCIIIYYYHFH